ncbi:HDIG domain-containing protein [candidate division KSB1 bacterium]|nr:HDIG domain-containing protein [candidate division KSB1 bacterium]
MAAWLNLKSFFKRKKNKNDEMAFPSTRGEKDRGIWGRILIAVALITILVFLLPSGQSLQFADLKEGSISPRRIVAPFSFEILKTREEYSRDRELAVRNLYPVFRRENLYAEQTFEQLDGFWSQINQTRRQFLTLHGGPRRVALDSLKSKFPISAINEVNWQILTDPKGSLNYDAYQSLQSQTRQSLRDLFGVGILNKQKGELENPDRRITLIEQNDEIISAIDDFYDLVEARARALEMLNAANPEEEFFTQIIFAVESYFIRSNIFYDEVENAARIEETQSRVPLSSGFVYEDEKIVDRNERITPEIRKKLVSLSSKIAEKGMHEGGIRVILPFIGKIGFVTALIFVFVVFIYLEKREILYSTKYVLLLSIIILLIATTSFLSHRLEVSEYFAPVAVGAMLLASIFNMQLAFAGTAILSLLVGAIWGNEFNLMAVSFFTGVVGILVIKRVRTRGQLVQAVFYMIGAQVLAITMLGLLRYLPIRQIVVDWQFGALNGLFTPIVAYGILALIESVFDITTDFALLELSNLNHPLLKRLSVEAPGTYHHSILVGNLAEAAAQAVNANSLLARVGCYYHDIGKLEKSEYFVENQMGSENPHNKLAPSMSALILSNHVKKGIDLASKYKLPKAIRDIMEQHHGKSVMAFFYQKALNKKLAEEVNETDYRYPGPLPQSKEAAIVMLADSIEAASRTLKEPTHSRLKGLIEDLVDERFQAGELDQSPLTLRDLQRIKESFLIILAGIFHARVEYPEIEESKGSTKGMIKKDGE